MTLYQRLCDYGREADRQERERLAATAQFMRERPKVRHRSWRELSELIADGSTFGPRLVFALIKEGLQ